MKRTMFFLLLGGFTVQAVAQKQLTVEDIYGGTVFKEKTLHNVQWIPGQAAFSYTEENDEKKLLRYELVNGQRELLFDSETLPVFRTLKRERRVIPESYRWSPDGAAILLNDGTDLYLFRTGDRQLRRLTDDAAAEKNPAFSPDGRRIAYLKFDNLHVLDLASLIETQLTREGGGHVLVGRFDWVYEEEFGIRTGFFWSPTSHAIAFYQLDESAEPEFPIVDYVPVHNTVENMRYPKAGDPNAIVKIGIVSLADGAMSWMDIGEEIDIYIPRIRWFPDGTQLCIQRLNRQQNRLQLLSADVHTGKTRILLSETETQGWIDIADDLMFLKKNSDFVWSSDRSGYRHLYLHRSDGTLIRPLTSGDWDVTEVVGVDEGHRWIYFIATAHSVFERHLYRVDFNGRRMTKLTTRPGSHTIDMTPEFSHFLDYFSDGITPTQVSLYTAEGRLLRVVEANELDALKDYRLTREEILCFETADGIRLNACLTKPADFDSTKKYPVLFDVYGGPGSQTVQNRWDRSSYLWRQLLAQKGYLVFQLDNRGTRFRGNAFMKQVYRRLGEFEVRDMVHGADYLKRLPYVDGERIGIWGWSYGGYTTLMCMLRAAEYFKVGVAVAPVSDWRNYDSIYTERYMDTPQNNPEAYEESSALKYADHLRGKLLLIHGSADDNVHPSNTFQLAYELQKLNKPFDLMIYPRKEHSIRDVRVHLFNAITDYILRHL